MILLNNCLKEKIKPGFRFSKLLLISFIAGTLVFGFSNSISAQDLRANFKDPKGTARPKVYWWWLNGYTDNKRLKEELISIKNAGLGGVDIFEIGLPPASDPNKIIPAGPAFMSDESLKTIKFAVDEAGKLGLEVGFNLASSWNAGGSWVEPRYASKTLYFSKTTINAFGNGKVKLPFPVITPDREGKPRPIKYGKNGKPEYREEIAVIAVPAGSRNLADTSLILNITANFDPKTETLDWKVPPGEWDVYRYICSNSGEQLIRPSEKSAGPIIDHFDSTATEMHLMYFINKLKPLFGDFSKTALKNLYLASYEAKEFAWTSSLPQTFKKLNGYDIYKFLPAVYNPKLFDPKTAEKFNTDFSRTFSELMIRNHYRKSQEISNKYGLKIISEAGGPGHLHHIPVETLKALGALDVPRGEYWYNRTFFKADSLIDYIWLVKEIAAASHIYKQGIVEEESFTSYWDWQEGPADLKVIADRAFCEGMNRLVIHGFPHNPTEMGLPGIAYFAGTHYNDRNTWWPKIKPFNDYLSRISYILQNSRFAADVLYYYGDDIPNLIPPKNSVFKVGDGYDYEVVNTEILLRDLTVEKGEWVLPGVGRYKVLALSKDKMIGKDAKAKLDLLQKKGGILASDNILEKLNLPPDFSYHDQKNGAIDFIHYDTEKQDFYLLRNTTDQWISRKCAFRQKNKSVEIWDPVSGEMSALQIYQQNGAQIEIPVTLPPHGSAFVVFSSGSGKPAFSEILSADKNPPKLSYHHNQTYVLQNGSYDLINGSIKKPAKATSRKTEISGDWQLTFSEKFGVPPHSHTTTLKSWTESADPEVKYFSGIASYSKTFNFTLPSKDQAVFLDLGNVSEVAEVWLNGKSLGISWSLPHRFEITGIAVNGKNTLKVEVANTWSNRLTGDAATGKKYTKTNIVKANKNLTPWEKVPLKKSGLLGPVVIESMVGIGR